MGKGAGTPFSWANSTTGGVRDWFIRRLTPNEWMGAPRMKIPKPMLPPEAFEAAFFPGWAISKEHYSKEFLERFARTIEQKKQVVAQAKASR
jgi:hypothetical protein